MYSNINMFENKNIPFKKIHSNFNDLVMSKYLDGRKNIVKHILIDDNKIYVSYLKKLNEECVKLGVVFSELNLEKLDFIEFFEIDNCQPYGGQMNNTGGNLSKFKDNKILLTVGDFGSYEVQKNDNPQKFDNMLGKILSIDKETKQTNIISLGHRNSQGLFYDKFDDVVYSIDHGPKGGDEINLDFTLVIKIQKILDGRSLLMESTMIIQINGLQKNFIKEPRYTNLILNLVLLSH